MQVDPHDLDLGAESAKKLEGSNRRKDKERNNLIMNNKTDTEREIHDKRLDEEGINNTGIAVWNEHVFFEPKN